MTPLIQDQRAITVEVFGPRIMQQSDIPDDHRFAEAIELAEAHPDRLVELPKNGGPIVHDTGHGIVLEAIGIVGFYAGPDVMIWDRHALADPIGARFELEDTSGRKGHERYIDDSWFDARMEGNPLGSDPSAAAAFLRCPRIDDLRNGISEPLTIDRLLDNVVAAIPDTFLRYPSDPDRALAVCDEISR